MLIFTFTTFLSIVLALDQALALVLRTPVEPYAPQWSMGQTPPECRDVCSAISNAKCTTDICLCTASNAIALQGCMKCVYSVSPTDAVRESVVGDFNQLIGTCKDGSLKERWISVAEPADPSITNSASSVGGPESSSSSETPSPPVVTVTASFPITETVYSTTSTHTPSTTVTLVVTSIVPPGKNPSSTGSSASSTQSASSASSNSRLYSYTSSLICAISLLSALLLCL